MPDATEQLIQDAIQALLEREALLSKIGRLRAEVDRLTDEIAAIEAERRAALLEWEAS